MPGPLTVSWTVAFEEVEDGWIMATAPELPGAVTQGRDMEEARANVREAIELLLRRR